MKKEKASAKTNALSHLLQTDDHLLFLNSATDEGRLCAEVLTAYYQKNGYQANTAEIEDLNYRESRFKMKGLHFLVEKLIELIQRKDLMAGRYCSILQEVLKLKLLMPQCSVF